MKKKNEIKNKDTIIPVDFDDVTFVYDTETKEYFAFIRITGKNKEIALSSYGEINLK
jgi:hypothetical protein